MQVALNEEQAAFRTRLLDWLASVEAPDGLRDYGATPTLADIGPAKEWQRILHRDGWAGLSWPRRHGGQDAAPVEQAVFAEEMARAGLPRQLNLVGLELVGPMIMAFGTARQEQRFLPSLLDGTEVWCQLFSEPEAGSDLAAVASLALPDADGWAVSGQKVWTSGAHYADYGLLLARTDPEARRHRGLSCFLLPMDRPGLEVRPLRQMDGESKFNEVFLDRVPLTPEDLLGELNQGWRVAISTLGRERLTLGASAVGLQQALDQIWAEAESDGVQDDSHFRQGWAQLWSRVQLLRLNWFRLVSVIEDGADPRMSVLKVTASELQRDVADFGMDLVGARVTAVSRAAWLQRFLAAPGATIAGGTSEIQRNILAERVLGLPRA